MFNKCLSGGTTPEISEIKGRHLTLGKRQLRRNNVHGNSFEGTYHHDVLESLIRSTFLYNHLPAKVERLPSISLNLNVQTPLDHTLIDIINLQSGPKLPSKR